MGHPRSCHLLRSTVQDVAVKERKSPSPVSVVREVNSGGDPFVRAVTELLAVLLPTKLLANKTNSYSLPQCKSPMKAVCNPAASFISLHDWLSAEALGRYLTK